MPQFRGSATVCLQVTVPAGAHCTVCTTQKPLEHRPTRTSTDLPYTPKGLGNIRLLQGNTFNQLKLMCVKRPPAASMYRQPPQRHSTHWCCQYRLGRTHWLCRPVVQNVPYVNMAACGNWNHPIAFTARMGHSRHIVLLVLLHACRQDSRLTHPRHSMYSRGAPLTYSTTATPH